jgi:hypothetical protein
MDIVLSQHQMALLAPVAALALWTIIVLLFMTSQRLPAFKKIGVDLTKAAPGGRYVDLESKMPERINWMSHNYTHLSEQPPVFYAVVIILALVGGTNEVHIALAWTYTGLRIVHSIWQMFFNLVAIRFLLFACATLCLLILSAHALFFTMGWLGA